MRQEPASVPVFSFQQPEQNFRAARGGIWVHLTQYAFAWIHRRVGESTKSGMNFEGCRATTGGLSLSCTHWDTLTKQITSANLCQDTFLRRERENADTKHVYSIRHAPKLTEVTGALLTSAAQLKVHRKNPADTQCLYLRFLALKNSSPVDPRW